MASKQLVCREQSILHKHKQAAEEVTFCRCPGLPTTPRCRSSVEPRSMRRYAELTENSRLVERRHEKESAMPGVSRTRWIVVQSMTNSGRVSAVTLPHRSMTHLLLSSPMLRRRSDARERRLGIWPVQEGREPCHQSNCRTKIAHEAHRRPP